MAPLMAIVEQPLALVESRPRGDENVGNSSESIRHYVPTSRRLSVEEYMRLAEEGFFAGERLELIEGQIIVMAPDGPLHADTIAYFFERLHSCKPDGTYLRCQSGLTVHPSSVPEPDLALIAGRPNAHRKFHPESALLVVEVAVSSLHYDRTVKPTFYAKAGVLEYWVVDPESRLIVLHTEPASTAEPAHYQKIMTLSGSAPIPSGVLINWSVTVDQLYGEFFEPQ